MHNTIKILLLCTTFFFAYPSEIAAQKKRNRVQKHIKKHHKKQVKHLSHHRYRHLPRRGKIVRRLGVGAVNINFKGAKLFVHNGVWYQPSSKRNRFVVVKAPIGIRIHRVPFPNRPKIIVNKNAYYYYYGTFYEKVVNTNAEEYVVVKAPIGAKIDALPEGYDTVDVNGITYYRFDDIHYKFIQNSDTDAYFIVTKAP